MYGLIWLFGPGDSAFSRLLIIFNSIGLNLSGGCPSVNNARISSAYKDCVKMFKDRCLLAYSAYLCSKT